jgi:hypothetical protein
MKASAARKTQSKLIPLELPTDLRLDLQAFCRHHFDAPMVSVIRKALQIFLDEQQHIDQDYARLLVADRQARLAVVANTTEKFTSKK